MDANPKVADSLEEFRVYQVARQLFDAFWDDSEILSRDVRGRELARQQVRSLDSICANIEEGYGRGFGKEWPHYLRIARGSARESRGVTNVAAGSCRAKCLRSVSRRSTRSSVVSPRPLPPPNVNLPPSADELSLFTRHQPLVTYS